MEPQSDNSYGELKSFAVDREDEKRQPFYAPKFLSVFSPDRATTNKTQKAEQVKGAQSRHAGPIWIINCSEGAILFCFYCIPKGTEINERATCLIIVPTLLYRLHKPQRALATRSLHIGSPDFSLPASQLPNQIPESS